MRAVIQRVSSASVEAEGETIGAIERGYLILLGVGREDTAADADRLWAKILKMRVFGDATGKTNLSLADVGGNVLIVSQFTLFADLRRGNRPSFGNAGAPGPSEMLYEHFVERARADVSAVGGSVQTGRFGANMQVTLVNDGPFTLLLDTDALAAGRSA